MIKTLILVRHAHALSALAAHVQSDGERPLSPEGREKAAFTAKRLKELNVGTPQLVTSPLLRARQTAEIIAGVLGCPAAQTVPELDGLHEDSTVRDFLCARLQTTDTLLAVGHNPNISVVNHLLCGQVRAFMPGSFSLLHLENGKVLPSFIFGE